MFQFALLPKVRALLTSLAKEEKGKEIRKKENKQITLRKPCFLYPKPSRAKKAELKGKRAKTEID